MYIYNGRDCSKFNDCTLNKKISTASRKLNLPAHVSTDLDIPVLCAMCPRTENQRGQADDKTDNQATITDMLTDFLDGFTKKHFRVTRLLELPREKTTWKRTITKRQNGQPDGTARRARGHGRTTHIGQLQNGNGGRPKWQTTGRQRGTS